MENRRNFPVRLASLHKQNHVRVHIIQQFCFTWITSLSCEEPYGERERKSLATVPAEVTTRLFAVKSSTVQNTCTLCSLWCRTHDTTTELSYRGKKKNMRKNIKLATILLPVASYSNYKAGRFRYFNVCVFSIIWLCCMNEHINLHTLVMCG